MSLTNPKTVVTEERLAEFYQRILPYLGQGSSSDSENGGHTILDTFDTELTQRDILKFSGDFDVSDDSTNEQTVVKPHELTFEELNEIITPVPINNNQKGVIFDERGTEYVVGQYILSDGTKKPVYEKTLTGTFGSATTSTNMKYVTSDHTLSGIEDLCGYIGTVKYTGSGNVTYECLGSSMHSNGGTNISTFLAADITNGVVTVSAFCNKDRAYTFTDYIIKVQYTKSTDTPV